VKGGGGSRMSPFHSGLSFAGIRRLSLRFAPFLLLVTAPLWPRRERLPVDHHRLYLPHEVTVPPRGRLEDTMKRQSRSSFKRYR
jgi:hypothetical protein